MFRTGSDSQDSGSRVDRRRSQPTVRGKSLYVTERTTLIHVIRDLQLVSDGSEPGSCACKKFKDQLLGTIFGNYLFLNTA